MLCLIPCELVSAWSGINKPCRKEKSLMKQLGFLYLLLQVLVTTVK